MVIFICCLICIGILFAYNKVFPVVIEHDSNLFKLGIISAVHFMLSALLFYGLLYWCYFADYITGKQFYILVIIGMVAHVIYLIYFYKIHKALAVPIVITMILIAPILYYEWPLWQLDKMGVYVTEYYPSEELGDTSIYVLGVTIYPLPKDHDVDRALILTEKPITNAYRYSINPRGIGSIMEGSRKGLDRSMDMAEKLVENDVNEDIQLKAKEQFAESRNKGTSAGLAFYLSGLIERGEIENRFKLGVTGAVSKDGDVLPVGSVYEKTVIAMLDNLDYIIVPKENEAEALQAFADYDDALKGIEAAEYNNSIQVVAFSTVADVKAWLEEKAALLNER